ncbi:MAG: asparagine synthase (glutamine-hydrolyzing) [Candidatus Riflebacteria bacterium HGW-Riflebacteria-2]|jgi:asparagine synthase (glutamine-hydrolysing)|nr:MAG: asparagine synthase (glutamine-hydrolyzing) [Candidatus Riflebacteria bacterium HGW-Riflebacteria-2]
MCGICGFIEKKKESNADSLTDRALRMSEAIRHRGPDAEGVWVKPEEGLALAHRRLAVLDLTAAGNQPMISPNGRYILILNGEVYNFIDIKRKIVADSQIEPVLKGHSDTEILLLAIEQYGVTAAIKLISGMFALALWDQKEKELTLARDKMGQKPLYYGLCREGLVFASELSCFKAFGRENWQIDREALLLYFRHNYIPAPWSILKNVHKLEPGHILRIRAAKIHCGKEDSVVSEPYWQLEESGGENHAGISQSSIAQNEAELEQLLTRAISLQMVADVPLGVFLSGGIDSSIVAAIMQKISSGPTQTFTIAFSEQDYNEADFARQVAGHLRTDHHEFLLNPKMALDIIPDLNRFYSEPFADPSQIPGILLCRLARKKVTVALTGDGGDELFGGYYRYFQAEKLYRIINLLPLSLRQFFAATLNQPKLAQLLACSSLPGGPVTGRLIRKMLDLLPSPDFTALYKTLVSHTGNPSSMLLDADKEPETVFDRRDIAKGKSNYLEKMIFCDLKAYLPDDILTKVDRAAMSTGLETRLPFLDQDVVDFARHLPTEQKIKGAHGKIILRRILCKYLPQSLIERPKKGFAVPMAAWLRGELKDWGAAMVDRQRLKHEGLLNYDLIKRMWYDHQRGKQSCERMLWNILMLQSWLEKWRS